MAWPAHFPANCPPTSGRPAAGEVYRFVEGAEPEAEDFRSYKELHPEEDFGAAECKSCGVSVYTAISDLELLARKIPAYRTKPVARGALTADLGVTLPTPSRERRSHVTWWIPLGVEPWKAFRVISLQKGGAS